MVKKSNKRFYNPFPREPSNIGFLKGKLMYDEKALHSKAFAAGEGFVVSWHCEEGGYMSVHHKDEPQRVLWSTLRGLAFVSGALGNDVVQESRGSFSIHDTAELVLTHQTIEQIHVVWPQEDGNEIFDESKVSYTSSFQRTANDFFHGASTALEDGDGYKSDMHGPAVLVTGCLYNDPKIAACQLKHYLVSQSSDRGPFYDINRSQFTQVGVRYWLFFGEKRKHHLGFSLKLEQPVKQAPDLPSLELFHPQVSNHGSVQALPPRMRGDYQSYQVDQMLWIWSQRPLSAFERTGVYNTVKRHTQPLLTLKRLIVNDMFKRTRRVANAEEVEKSSLLLLGLDSYDSNKPTNAGNFEGHSSGQVLDCSLNRVVLTYAAEEDEQFFGFGEQFSFFNLKGRRVPIMVQEQGLGRGDQPITAAVNLIAERSGGDWHTTYAPVPYYITSKSRCVFLEEYKYSVFDLSRTNQVQIQLHGETMQGRIVHGQTPLQLIERYTEAIGRMRELPDWIMEGAIVGMQGGTQSVRNAWNKLKAADVPISAFWLQDWVGQRKTSIGWQLWWNWELDEEHYSGWTQLVGDLKAEGINTMAYLNPFLAKVNEKPKRSRDLFEEAKRLDYLVKSPTGSAYMIPNTSFDAAMVDLTNPEACKWLKSVMQGMIGTGVKGWMADFGESLPFDAGLHSNEDPRVIHNKYPELWAQLNHEVVKECGDNELVFFMRSAYMKSPRWSTLFWEGDQMVSWQRHDGIKSAVVGLLSGGVSGFAFNHSDIGGYCTVDLPFLRYHRSEELLLRWMELNAFSTIFRTHEGNIPSVNHQFSTSPRSLQHFARFAKIHKAWAFYRKLLVQEASKLGLPIVRHMFLHYPHDLHTMSISYEQFLVGSEILVVPVVDKGRDYVWAYFPMGSDEWQHVWTGNVYASSQFNKGLKVRVHSPLGYPAVFVKRKSQIGQKFLENLDSLHLLSMNNKI